MIAESQSTTHALLDKVESLLQDISFGSDASEKKLHYYANKYPDLVEYHPLLLVYCCASQANLDECIRLIAALSDHANFKISQPDSNDIMQAIDFVIDSSTSTSTIKTIIDCENRFLETIKSVPVLFIKACIDKQNFNRDQLYSMLQKRNKIQTNELSLHDASVDVGTALVDQYVKPKLKH